MSLDSLTTLILEHLSIVFEKIYKFGLTHVPSLTHFTPDDINGAIVFTVKTDYMITIISRKFPD